ncbi:MAG TPA: phenylacetic acid degradation protein PaaN [Terriglobales bacterium]|nr:phenylacetic acid degradation protein PaaN [Terriglobales bacterium]
MPHPLFAKHQALLEQAVAAINQRGYWTPFVEMPSPKAYGEEANAKGLAAFEARRQHPFALAQQPSAAGDVGDEVSPFGPRLGIRYPKVDVDALLAAAQRASGPDSAWRQAGPQAWVGVALEILARLNQRSFEIAYAVMHTTGQAFLMAFQAGGPHAQDRGVEAVAYAWQEMSRIPKTAIWEKPQGKNPPLRMEKRFDVVPRGVALVIGCCTFPTWNGYPGLFASLATGNAVLVKPHPGATLPLAITVEIAREVLAENGFDPNVVTLAAHAEGDELPQRLALRPEIKIIDFTGSPAHGEWLERNARQAQVYTEKAGVNSIVVDSTADFAGLARNVAFSLALYSGQMCTAPQNVLVPRGGIATAEGFLSFDQVADGLAQALGKLLGDPARAIEVLGAIQNDGILAHLEQARRAPKEAILADSQTLTHPQFPEARVRTPLLLRAAASDEAAFMHEVFGPVAFVIATASTDESLALAGRAAREHGALTLSVYSTAAPVLEKARGLAREAGVPLSENLTGGVFVNQSAAFSDFHGTGANPAANAALTDTAFVASRFRVVQSRAHIA